VQHILVSRAERSTKHREKMGDADRVLEGSRVTANASCHQCDDSLRQRNLISTCVLIASFATLLLTIFVLGFVHSNARYNLLFCAFSTILRRAPLLSRWVLLPALSNDFLTRTCSKLRTPSPKHNYGSFLRSFLGLDDLLNRGNWWKNAPSCRSLSLCRPKHTLMRSCAS
jgi:hypothetical protein